MVVGILRRRPGGLQPLVHAAHGGEPGGGRRGALPVLAQHLPRPLARIVALLLVAGEAVGAERARHEPALARTRDLVERIRVARDAPAGEVAAEELRPFPAREAHVARTPRARLAVEGKRNRRARRLVRPEPRLDRDGGRRVARVQPRAEVAAPVHRGDVVALPARLRKGDRTREAAGGGHLLALRVARRELVYGNRAAPVPVRGRKGGQARERQGRETREKTGLHAISSSPRPGLPGRNSTRRPRGRRRSAP